jgi:predicted peroxiredoxin
VSELVFIGTHGPDDPTKAVLPFVLAGGASRSRDGIEAAIVLLGDAVSLVQPVYRQSVVPLGYPPLKELLPPLVERSVPFYI